MDPLKRLELQQQIDNPNAIRKAAGEMSSAYNDRKRIFRELQQPMLPDSRLADLQKAYIAASKLFEEKRAAFMRAEVK